MTFVSFVARYRLTEELRSLEHAALIQSRHDGLIDVEKQGGRELFRAAWSRIINPRIPALKL
ncbi:hypothetical protein [Bradyrhizobium vignae]|uniref:hypothetical protein n=1 Tax=Bradyrhizobium vignae TaxID=1549949 RepID=UPI00100C232D|nr:hypothetical protein [Bradyrhizobium vignae]RXG84471.1 hypothetical protein EAV90_37055 [Bradyrhizobium vignae]